MPDNFGLKIGIDGVKKLKNTHRKINQTLKVLGSEMNFTSNLTSRQMSQAKEWMHIPKRSLHIHSSTICYS
jgi:hypothetical protein